MSLKRQLVLMILLAGVVIATPAVAVASPAETPTSTAQSAHGDPPLPEYPGLPPLPGPRQDHLE
jgi:hypothetical protein